MGQPRFTEDFKADAIKRHIERFIGNPTPGAPDSHGRAPFESPLDAKV